MIAWLARVKQRAAWSYKLMSWDVCGQPAAFEISHLSFQERKNIGHVFQLPWRRYPSPRTEQTYRFMWCITQLWMCLVCVVSPLGYGFQSNTFKHTCTRTHTYTPKGVNACTQRDTCAYTLPSSQNCMWCPSFTLSRWFISKKLSFPAVLNLVSFSDQASNLSLFI